MKYKFNLSINLDAHESIGSSEGGPEETFVDTAKTIANVCGAVIATFVIGTNRAVNLSRRGHGLQLRGRRFENRGGQSVSESISQLH